MPTEIAKPEWRLNNLYYVVNKQGQRVKFTQNSVQRKLNQYKEKRKRILKARQMGISTNELLRQLDYVLFNKNKTACILAHEQDGLEKLFRIVKRAYFYMPDSLKPAVDRGGGSKYELYFPSINSRIYCDLESRGDTIHWLHVSEKAFSKDKSRVLATIEAVPIDGVVTEETTPNGMNHFYDDWMQEDTNYKNIFLPWFLHDEYSIDSHELSSKDLTNEERELIERTKRMFHVELTLGQIAFRRFKQRELKGMFKQEYPEDDATCFLTSGGNPFQLDIIKPMYDNAPKPLRVVNGIRIYKEREPNQLYVVAGDPAEGVDGDNSAAHVFKVSTREQVASFHGKLKPSEFADKLVEMASMYESKLSKSATFDPLLGVERNNHGHAVLLKLSEILQYTNLFKHDKDSDKLGWITDKITRPLMIDAFIEGVENGTIKLNDRDTLSELLTLINNNGKIEAETGKHDDLFIAACISIQLCIEEGAFELYSNDVAKLIKI